MIDRMIKRAREIARARLGVGPEQPVFICRVCRAAYLDERAFTCGSIECAREMERYEAALRGEERSLGWAHNPAVAGSTPAPATSVRGRKRRAA